MNDDVKSKINYWVSKGKIPNILFVGEDPKYDNISIAISISKGLFGYINWQHNLYELNVPDFENEFLLNEEVKRINNRESIGASYKIILVRNVDKLSERVQATLRQWMLSRVCMVKFILTCENINNVIHPIRDRCVELKFK
jgi:DNA polymerase III delta prime subunit